MNVVFVGYRKWAYQILKNLLRVRSKNWQFPAVITTLSPEANFRKLPIPVLSLDPQKLNEGKNLEKIRKFNPNVLLFYGWSWIIPKELYKRYTCLILHPSPLPKYRGGSPIQHQIIAGETISAVTILKATAALDAGPIYSQTPFPLYGNLSQIFNRIVKIGTKDTKRALDDIANNTMCIIPQDESKATYYKRRKPKDSELKIEDFKRKTAIELYNFMRALADPYPNAFIKCKDGKKLLLKSAKVASE